VSDAEIVMAIPKLAQETGVFVEPAAAAAYAGFIRMCESGALESHERVLLMLTGNGLKDIDSARRTVREPMRVAPEIEMADLGLRIANSRNQRTVSQ
jgi:threonine synthase